MITTYMHNWHLIYIICVWYSNPYHMRMVIPYAYMCMVCAICVWYEYTYCTEYQHSITIAASLFDSCINIHPSPLIIYSKKVSLASKIYETCYMVLIYPSSCTSMAEAQIPSLHPHNGSTNFIIIHGCWYTILILMG